MGQIVIETLIAAPVELCFDLARDVGVHAESAAFTGERLMSPGRLNGLLENILQMPGSRVLNYAPSLMLALEDTCRLQCRLSIETRTNAYQIRTGQFPDAPISVYFTVRQYWGRQPYKTFLESYANQRKVCQDLVDSHIIPAVLRPLNQTIGNKQ